eukprot:CAMPEP_0170494094 /NCGR_PEP_ID=MMETSP0208-20121228/14443_1 /TAXON_ID=197538 /ORGANISM="Strombidium inclinatum, Strain S3" /LENGTH=155 /DNA_ID=CAMNT_0010770103 /DNA_START=4956 /DNA_END=5423 /DNA_ORIENTATION=+
MRASYGDFVASVPEVILNFHPILDLLALRARDALLGTLFLHVLLQVFLSELLGTRALVRTGHQLGLTGTHQVVINLVVLQVFRASESRIRAAELERVQHLSVELVYLARGGGEAVAAIFFGAEHGRLLSALEADYVLAFLALHRKDDDVLALGAD